MGQWSSKMSNAAMSYPRDTWYTVYLWGLSVPSTTVSDDKDGIRETPGHSFYVKGFSYLWPQPHFLRCWAGQLHGLVIKTFLSTFGVKIISLDELNINPWSQKQLWFTDYTSPTVLRVYLSISWVYVIPHYFVHQEIWLQTWLCEDLKYINVTWQ